PERRGWARPRPRLRRERPPCDRVPGRVLRPRRDEGDPPDGRRAREDRAMRLANAAAVLALALGLAGASGCGGGPCGRAPNQLTGSIGELYDIKVDNVRARKVDDTHVTFEFLHGNDIVAKIVADVRAFTKGTSIPLVNGDVYRLTSPSTDFP